MTLSADKNLDDYIEENDAEGVRQMSDEYILDDVVETFSDEDTLLSDIQQPCEVVAFLGRCWSWNGLHHVGTSHLRGGVGELGLPTGLEWILAIFVTGNCSSRLSCYFLRELVMWHLDFSSLWEVPPF